MPFVAIGEETRPPARRGGFTPLVAEEEVTPQPMTADPVALPSGGDGGRILSGIASAIKGMLASALPARGSVMDEPTPEELDRASRPATGLVRTPAGRQFGDVQETRPTPAPPPPVVTRQPPVIGPPSRNPITNEVAFTPFNEGRTTLGDAVAEAVSGAGRGADKLKAEYVGGLASAIGGSDAMKGAREAIKEATAGGVEARARMGGESAAVTAGEAVPGSLAYMGAFSSRFPLIAGQILAQPGAAEKYHHHVKNGASPIAAFAASQGHALAETLPEKIGWNLLVNLFRLPANATRREFLTRLGVQQVGENVEEQITALANHGISKVMSDPDATPEKLWQEMKETAKVSMILTPLLSTGAVAARGAVPLVRAIEQKLMRGQERSDAIHTQAVGDRAAPIVAQGVPAERQTENEQPARPAPIEEKPRAEVIDGAEELLLAAGPPSEASDVVRRQRETEARLRAEGQWQAMTSRRRPADEVVAEMSVEEARAALDRLNAAPGDDRAVRSALEKKLADDGDEPLTTGGPPSDAGVAPERRYYEPFKAATGKYPWEMPFPQFFKATVSKLKAAQPGQPAPWYERVIRSEWMKAQGVGGGALVAGGPPAKVEPSHYPLSERQQAAHDSFAARVEADPDGMVDEYLANYAGQSGNIISADDAKELSPEYRESPAGRREFAKGAHEGASAVAKLAYARLLSEPIPPGKAPVVLFTGGGSGVGKTSGLKANEDLSVLVRDANVVYDANFDRLEGASAKIEQALAAGRSAAIVYTFRAGDPIAALGGVLKRAMNPKNGRTVILPVIESTARGALKTARALEKLYANDQRVSIHFIDSTVRGEPREMSSEELAGLQYNVTHSDLKHALQTAYSEGRITREVYLDTLGEPAATPSLQREGVGEESRAGDDEKPAEEPTGGDRGRAAEGEISPVGGPREEVTDERGGAAPKPGDPFLVYRLGRQPTLDNRNAGNAQAVAMHLARTDDPDKPQPRGGIGDTIIAYEVTVNEPFGGYETHNAQSPASKQQVGRAARSNGHVQYSFPAGGKWTAKVVGKVPLAKVREILKARGLNSFDDSGAIEGGNAIRAAFEEQRTPELVAGGPPGRNWFDVELSNGIPVYQSEGYAPLTEEYQRTVSAALDDLVARGLPSWLITEVGGFVVYPESKSHHGGLYFPDRAEAIGISVTMMNDARTLRTLLAHEFGHAIDRNVDENGQRKAIPETYRRGAGSRYYQKTAFASAASEALEIEKEEAVDSVSSRPTTSFIINGVLAREIMEAIGGLSPTAQRLRDHFAYPLDLFFSGQITELANRIELTAQVHALYFAEPETVRDRLPRWFRVMEHTYGPSKSTPQGELPSRSRAAAHARLRDALQNAGAELEGEGGFARDNETLGARLADRVGSQRGPPGARVGEGARSDQRAAGGPGIAAGARPGAASDERAGDDRGIAPPGGPPPGNRGNAYWDFDEPGMKDNFIREWQNNKIDLKHVQQEILRFGGVLRDDNNAYLAEERYHGRVSALLKKFNRDLAAPLLKEIKDSNVTIEEVGRFLWARHAPERNAQMARINPGGPANLSGMYDDAAAATAAGAPGGLNAADILAEFRRQGKTAAMNRVARLVDGITTDTRQLLVRDGLEEQNTVNNWQRVYRNYVPLMRDSDDAFSRTGTGFQIRGPESKRAMGSQREAVAIVAAVIAQHERAIIRAEKADAGRTLIKLAEEFPNPDFWRVDQPPTKRSINKSTGLVEVGIDPTYRQRDDVFIVKEPDANGNVKERVLVFNPQSERAMKLVAAMKNLDVVQLSGVTKVVGKVTRLLANLATSWNPLFWATNFARDVQTAAVNLQSTPLQGRAPQVIANIPKAIAGIMSAEFRNGTGRWATIYREFQEQGGQTGWMTLFESLIDRQTELEAEIRASQRGTLSPLRMGAFAMETINKVNGAIENATRLSAYAEARDRGLSPRQAASLAKNLTVNFNRKGNRSSATNAWYMFVNANVQGTARLIQAVAKSRRAQAYVGVMVAFGAALELINRLIGDADRDEDGNNPHELVPEYVKQKNMVFILPGGKTFKIPLPYGFNVFHNSGRMMMEAVLGAAGSELVDEKKKPLEAAWNFTQVVIDSFLPLGQASSIPQLIAPTVLDPAVQWAENKTWFGAPMRPEPLQYGAPKPNNQLFFRSTSESAKEITKWLSDATGGDEIKGGSIDISPTTLTHIFGTVTGGTGRFGLGMFDFSRHMMERAIGTAEPEDLPWNKVPFVGTFYGELSDRERAAKFYRLRKEAFEVDKQVKGYRKMGEDEKAAELEAEKPALAAMARAIADRDFKREMKDVRERGRAIEQMPAGERVRAKRELAAEETAIMSNALRAYNERLKETRP